MSQNRVQKLVKIINKTAIKAGDSDLDLNRNEVESERKKMMKTFKEFVEAVTPSRFEPGETNYGNQSYQDRLTKARKKEKEEKAKQQQGTSDKLHLKRTEGPGIYGNYTGHGWGYMKTDSKTGKKIFTPADN
jgi:hypothetical protein